MWRIVAFVAILITVRVYASERDKRLDEPKGAHINTKYLLSKQENERSVKEKEHFSVVDRSKINTERFRGTQDDFEEEHESDYDDIQEDESESEDIQENSIEETDSDSESFPDDYERKHLAGDSMGSFLSKLNDMMKKANPDLPKEVISYMQNDYT
jgi:hypothetical protein